MYKRLFFTLSLTLFLIGCGAKKEAATSSEMQDALNQTVSTQTELTLMQDKNAAQSQAGKPAKTNPVVSANVAATEPAAPASTTTSPTNEQIQQALKNANLYQGEVDGNVGLKTKKAIREFQEQNGLRADGKVGAKTWAKLQTHLSQPSDNSATEQKD